MADPLEKKQIVVGVCGGIAAYKAAEFVRRLTTCNATVRVVMTEAARAFVGPVTFQALSRNPVWTDMFEEGREGIFRHIEWAQQADAAVIIPATANIIGKLAHGMADDPLTTLILGVRGPIVVCPSMNVRMYENPFVQKNISSLTDAGFHIVGPAAGSLACGDEGQGRLVEIDVVMEECRRLLSTGDLSGEKILVTAGPTREAADPVRFISNPSSGKMGYALAVAARRRGAQVVLVSGPTYLAPPVGVELVSVTTAKEMFDAVMARLDASTIILKAAAVSDWRPAQVLDHKAKKNELAQSWPFEKTEDILKAVGEHRKGQILVGFAAETDDVEQNARSKIQEKKLDLIVANKVGVDDSGFASETNRATLIDKNGTVENLTLMDKASLADIILDRVLDIKGKAGEGTM